MLCLICSMHCFGTVADAWGNTLSRYTCWNFLWWLYFSLGAGSARCHPSICVLFSQVSSSNTCTFVRRLLKEFSYFRVSRTHISLKDKQQTERTISSISLMLLQSETKLEIPRADETLSNVPGTVCSTHCGQWCSGPEADQNGRVLSLSDVSADAPHKPASSTHLCPWRINGRRKWEDELKHWSFSK